ncbi:MAG: hypothetical protein AABY53_06980, partial [Bdellovibrionota bacterium]
SHTGQSKKGLLIFFVDFVGLFTLIELFTLSTTTGVSSSDAESDSSFSELEQAFKKANIISK